MNNPQREQQYDSNDPRDPRDSDQREYNERSQPRAYNEQAQGGMHQEHRYDGDMWAGMGEYRQRFDQLQMNFIEEPKETVAKAESLAKEAVDRMTRTLQERLNHIHSEHGDGSGDTERMRVAMSHYRELMDSLSGRHAA